MILPRIEIDEEHGFSLFLKKNGGAKEKTSEWGQESAKQLISISWPLVFITFVVITNSHFEVFLYALIYDIFLRSVKIKSYIFKVPVFVWCFLFMGMFYFDSK